MATKTLWLNIESDKNQPPNILYKYRSYNDNAKRILSNGEIYFATSDELNDPLERFFLFKNGTYHTVTKNDLLNLQTIKQKRLDNGSYLVQLDSANYTKHVSEKIKQREKHGIFSLCDSKLSIPMFAHYADGFKGICIGFDWKNFNLLFAGSHPPQLNIPRRVTYLTNPPEIGGTPDEWLNVFTTKSLDFEWESEWRMFYNKGKLSSVNIRHAIKEIIIGHNISKDHIAEIRKLISDLNGVSLFITEPIIGKFELRVVPFTNENTGK